MYDVIVVGARCSGSPVAMLLARRGHRVLAVDRATFPSDTVSTHFIHQTGLARLKAWGLLDRLEATGVPPVRHMRFSVADLHVEGFADTVEGVTEAYCPRRTVLDKILVDAAREAGAEVIEGFTATDVLFEEGRAAGIRGVARDGTEEEFRARFVVGADGPNSVVATKVGAGFYRVVPALGFVYYSYYSGLDWGHHSRIRDERQFATCPTNDGLHMLAVMRKPDRYQEFRADAEGGFQAVFDRVVPELGEDLRAHGKREEDFRGIRYADNYYRQSHGPGWALVGDAGYHKDPLTGWGITDAFRYGELLAQCLHSGLSGERPIDDATAEYARRRDEESAGLFQLTVTMASLTLPPFFQAALTAASQSPTYLKKFFAMVAGGYPGEDFFAPRNLERLYEEVGTPVENRLLTAADRPAG
ncbi:NAD(P)/FAD-dependent oxidoreductase [Parafrankia discariae]|uniref:NAD(P)/FAD-dependent oxidoreductase n=1 Tax=Parafrankia discariae TaxID=365528 RepID=UPI000477E8C7|nr:NAD(P)/FAD-dependent oxidoreductase [Parafrankia discariae]